jgi:hypothetical protein
MKASIIPKALALFALLTLAHVSARADEDKNQKIKEINAEEAEIRADIKDKQATIERYKADYYKAPGGSALRDFRKNVKLCDDRLADDRDKIKSLEDKKLNLNFQ